MQKEDQNNIAQELFDFIPKSVLSKKNKNKSWKYGYDPKYDVVVISKTGQIGSVLHISGLNIALPKYNENAFKRSKKKSDQHWERFQYPSDRDWETQIQFVLF